MTTIARKNIIFDIKTRVDGKGLNQVDKQVDGLKSKMSGIRGAFAGFLAADLFANAIRGIGQIATESVRLADAQISAEAKVRQAIQSTNGAAQRSLEDLKKSAADLQDGTLFGDEDILNNVSAQLLTFTNIAGDQFDRTQKVALDLATVLDGDLKSASIQLGKALNDPSANLSALSRSGIQFSKDQKEVIKSLQQTGRLSEAQGVILAELERQYGGQAAAALQGAGALDQLANKVGDAQESIGRLLLPALNSLARILTRVLTGVIGFIDGLTQIPAFIKENRVEIGILVTGLILLNRQMIFAAANTLRLAVIQKAQAISTSAVTAAQRLLNIALTANPIGIVITLIGGLIIGLVRLFKTNERFRKGVLSAFDAVRKFATQSSTLRDTLILLAGPIAPLVSLFTNFIKSLREGFSFIQSTQLAFLGLKDSILGFINGIFGSPIISRLLKKLGLEFKEFGTDARDSLAFELDVQNLQEGAKEIANRFGIALDEAEALIVQKADDLNTTFSNAISKVAEDLEPDSKAAGSKIGGDIVDSLGDTVAEGSKVVAGSLKSLQDAVSDIQEKLTSKTAVTDIPMLTKLTQDLIDAQKEVEQAQLLLEFLERSLSGDFAALAGVEGLDANISPRLSFSDEEIKADTDALGKRLGESLVDLQDNPEFSGSLLSQIFGGAGLLLTTDEDQQLRDSLANASAIAIDSINTILEAQEKATERGIELQKERVDAARELAREGSEEQLKIETDRLNELQDLQERAARRRQQLAALEIAANQAVAISNSIVAITEQAKLPFPANVVAIGATSIALGLQLAAATQSISSAFGSIPAFKDGIDLFRGEGTNTSDSNLVRISNNEGVIDAKTNLLRLRAGLDNKTLRQISEQGLGRRLSDVSVPSIAVSNGVTQSGIGSLEREFKGVRSELQQLRQEMAHNKPIIVNKAPDAEVWIRNLNEGISTRRKLHD